MIWFHSDIVRYINHFFEDDIEILLSNNNEIEMILNKYHEMIHDWDEVDTIELRKDISDKAWKIIQLHKKN